MAVFGLVGAGGFGREVMAFALDALRSAEVAHGSGTEMVFVDDRLAGQTINGRQVVSLAAFEQMEQLRLFNIAIADAHVRRRLANQLRKFATPVSLIAPNVVVGENNVIGAGAILCPFVTVTCNAQIGEFFHANIYSYVAHDCVLGDFVTFAPAVKCNGSVRIEDDAYLGTSCVLRQGLPERPLNIGRASTVGMGAVVTKSVDAGATVIGNPARSLTRTS